MADNKDKCLQAIKLAKQITDTHTHTQTLVMIYRPQMLHTFTSNTQYALIVILMIKMETNYSLVARAESRVARENG